ncbi:MAG: DVUA0089 family protein [Polyangiaceae bacterium]
MGGTAGSGGEPGGGGIGGTTTDTTSTTTDTTSTTTTSTTTTSTTTTTTTVTQACTPPAAVAGFGLEAEPNASFATATALEAGTQGWIASICPAGDVDVLAIPVTVPGSSLTIEIKAAGAAGCPPGAATYLRLFDSDNVLVAEDLTSGAGNCSLISPAKQAGVVALPAGTYYAQVQNLQFTKIDAYAVEVSTKAPACGDGVTQPPAGEQCDDGNTVPGDGCDASCQVEAVCGDGITHAVAGEQCDDGNTDPGDGCSPTCQLEVVLVQETEPNPQANPNSLIGYDGAFGAISPAGDTDWFSFDVEVDGSSVTISTSNGLNGCPSGADTVITLYNSNNALLAQDDEDGAASCSLISPLNDAGATNLAAGTYKVKVEDYGNNNTIGSYVLLVDVAIPGCGDGLVQIGEQCDDANTDAGDGCSPTCQYEGNYTTEVEPNPSATPNAIDGFDGVIAQITPVGDQDAFSFNVTVPGSSVTIETSNGIGGCPGFDSVITLYNPAGMAIATDDEGGVDSCSKIDPGSYQAAKNLAAGTYKVVVTDYLNNDTSAPYVLTVKVQAPACGDGLVGGTEQCDDGNATPGDGCTDMCMSEAPWEIEPNGDLASATAPWAGFDTWKGSIQASGDQDWYKLAVTAGQALTIELHAVNDPMSCPFDSKIHLVNGAGTEILVDDDSGVGSCSLINPALYPMVGSLAAGAYYVWVEPFGGASAAGPYQLTFQVQ